MKNKKLLKQLSEAASPSGREHWIHPILKECFSPYGENSTDSLNTLYIHKKGTGCHSILLMAHADEVFLMVSEICERGFLKFTAAGIDPKVLVSQEVLIHGKQKVDGIIGLKPPHLMTEEEKETSATAESLLIDTGLSTEALESIVKIGDFITLKREFVELLNHKVAGKSLDDKAGIVAMYSCAKELENISHALNVHFAFSSQEEVGHRGAKVASYKVNPTFAVAIDTTFDNGPMGDEDRENRLGKGPVICIGPNIHPKLRAKFMEIAKEYSIPFQVEVEPGNTGTDAWDIQISREGIPTLLLSLPVKYMHTSVEVIHMEDIKNCGKLLAKFIESIKEEEVEELLCF